MEDGEDAKEEGGAPERSRLDEEGVESQSEGEHEDNAKEKRQRCNLRKGLGVPWEVLRVVGVKRGG